MINFSFFICLILIFFSSNLPAFSQDTNTRKFNPDQPIFFSPKSHDPNFLKSAKLSTRSFYQRKSDWQHIIDSTWGPGAPLEEKLQIYNAYAQKIHDESDVLCFLNLNWDSLYNHYLNQITESTSKGAFSSIMSHFAYDLKDGHTFAIDSSVVFSALNPGVPLLFLGSGVSVERFGAVTTILPDSTTLVLRVVPDHPLNLEPGDIILGYEGVPWKKIVRELLDGGLPMLATTGGCKSADAYGNLSGAGINWHLFSTIDILKYSTGDTLHLSVLPLLNLDIQTTMVNNEQLAIQNIPFPKFNYWENVASDTVVTYGILENANVGYIFLAKEPVNTDNDDIQFYEAVNALKNTDALIIDLRLNLGGLAKLEKAFDILFNEYHKTLEHANRCNINTFELCPWGNWKQYEINGKDPDYYDRPIAVLLGPTCVSNGEIIAQRLSYHPMVRFFGASSVGAYGNPLWIEFPDWWLYYSSSDLFHTSQPGVYLNRKEFPIDYPVWFNKEDVAKGIDPIVKKSLEWINNLSYGHDLSVVNGGLSAVHDTMRFTAIIENTNLHKFSSKLIFEKLDGSVVDSTDLIATKLIDGTHWQAIWMAPNLPENFIWVSLKVTDQTEGTSFTNKHMTRILNVPLLVDSLPCTYSFGSDFTFQPILKNAGKTLQLNSINVNITSNDPWVKSIFPSKVICSSLKPGQIRRTPSFVVRCDAATLPNFINLKMSFTIDGWTYWVKDTTIVIAPTTIKPELTLALANALDQNYPNPFNSNTTITWQLAHSSRATLKVYDLVGRVVAIPVDEQRPAGKYETEFNAATLPKGVYFYQLKAGEFVQTRKMILMK